jgi:hypothetical protein
MDNNLERAKNMKLLLSAFEQLSELKINFHRSELFCYGAAKAYQFEYVYIFECDLGSLLFRYLGIPMHHRKLTNNDWKH